jgi:ribonucleoside-diphosphate reductase alpha chain
MIKISKKDPHIAELKIKKEAVLSNEVSRQNEIYKPIENRPEVVDAKVYKLKSAFVKNSVFVTLSYLKLNNKCRPVEIFINSKDLTRAPEYVVLTRLISAIFRRSSDPMFILEELQGIYDPSGGSYKNGKYYHSFYAEIADVIERFFFDVKILDKPIQHPIEDNGLITDKEKTVQNINSNSMNSPFRICPECSNPTLKIENGCDNCVDPECGYSKCDK